MNENIVELLNKDEYYLFYQMMMLCLKTDDVMNGLNKSLYLLKVALNCGDVILHKKNEDDVYTYVVNNSGADHITNSITNIVNQTAKLIEKKGIFNLNLKLSDNFYDLMLVYIKAEEHSYILSLNNLAVKENIDSYFFDKVKETMQIILKRAEMYERNTLAIKMDILTGVHNRNSYENRIMKIDEEKKLFVYGLFDLFRLKYINDNYSHAYGDLYIKETAKILKKYWPDVFNVNEGDTFKSVDSGHCIYRIGGDEFALLSSNEDIELTKMKASLAAEEVSMIDLGIKENLPLGLNYGIVLYNSNENIKGAYEEADHLMSIDKKNMYNKYGLERRR